MAVTLLKTTDHCIVLCLQVALIWGNAHVWQVKHVGNVEAVDGGESSESEQAVVFWARISLQLWKDEEKQYVCLYFQMCLTEQAPSACFCWRHFPSHVKQFI